MNWFNFPLSLFVRTLCRPLVLYFFPFSLVCQNNAVPLLRKEIRMEKKNQMYVRLWLPWNRKLNPMQEAALACAAGEREDVILLSPTGTGKTLAYCYRYFSCWNRPLTPIQAMILVPSRELVLQIETVLKTWIRRGKLFAVTVAPIAEGRKSTGQPSGFNYRYAGTYHRPFGKGNFNPDTIHTLVIDEFDKSLEFGFQDEMAEIINQLPGLAKRMLYRLLMLSKFHSLPVSITG